VPVPVLVLVLPVLVLVPMLMLLPVLVLVEVVLLLVLPLALALGCRCWQGAGVRTGNAPGSDRAMAWTSEGQSEGRVWLPAPLTHRRAQDLPSPRHCT
jgi:hypothetical protein